MPLYSCEHCNLSTKLKGDYKRHLNTSKHLNKLKELVGKSQKEPKRAKKEPKRAEKSRKEPIENEEITEFICDYCEETFKTFANKRRHEIHRCKANTSITNKLFKALNNEKKEKKQLYKQIEKLIDKAGNTTNIQTNHATQNIQLNSYGKEDLSHITDSLKTQLVQLPYGMIPKMIEEIHFSDSKPENKNISITNSRDNKIKVFKDDKWIYKSKEETINDLMDGKYFILDAHYENICNNLNETFQSRYETFRTYFDERDKNMYEQLKKECELMLLNNR
jgi:hypothetical protein